MLAVLGAGAVRTKKEDVMMLINARKGNEQALLFSYKTEVRVTVHYTHSLTSAAQYSAVQPSPRR